MSERSWGINTPLHFLPHPDLLLVPPSGWTQLAARGQELLRVRSIKFSSLGHKAGGEGIPQSVLNDDHIERFGNKQIPRLPLEDSMSGGPR